MLIQVFKETSQPNMEKNFINAVKAKQIQNTDIEDLIEFRYSRHFMQWAAMGAVQQVVAGEMTEREAFERLKDLVHQSAELELFGIKNIETMEENGIVSPMNSNGSREVL